MTILPFTGRAALEWLACFNYVKFQRFNNAVLPTKAAWRSLVAVDEIKIFTSLPPIRFWSVRDVAELIISMEATRFMSLTYPDVILLDTTNVCNARCPFCPLFAGDYKMDRDQRPAGVMSDVLFDKIVSETAGWESQPTFVISF